MQGWRKTHEDAHVVNCQIGGSSPAGVFAVLDGHGGSYAAQVGAELLEERLVRLARQGVLAPDFANQAIREAFLDADERLRERLPEDNRSGSTVVAAIVTQVSPGEFCVQMAHAGDSRAVLCIGGNLVCSEDHKPGRPDETRRIRAAGGTVEHGSLGAGPLRVDGALAVSRAIGDFHFKPRTKAPAECKVTAVPEVSTTRCRAGDWLLLACDGIFDVVSNEEVRDFVSSRLQAASSVSRDSEGGIGSSTLGWQIAAQLINICVERGSKDNCTAMLIQMVQATEPHSKRRHLIQGRWQNAPSDVKAKYAEFFHTEGFEAEARAVESTLSAADRQPAAQGLARAGSLGAGGRGVVREQPHAVPPAGRGHPVGAAVAAGAAGSRGALGAGRASATQTGAVQMRALAKALQAMRTRARRDGDGPDGGAR